MYGVVKRQAVVYGLACLLAFGLLGCLGAGLSEEAQPQTPEERFLVQIAEFKALTVEANLWLDGVLGAALAGDPVAIASVPAAERIDSLMKTGTKAIKAAEAARSRGDLGQFLADGQIVQSLLLQLQAEVAKTGVQ